MKYRVSTMPNDRTAWWDDEEIPIQGEAKDRPATNAETLLINEIMRQYKAEKATNQFMDPTLKDALQHLFASHAPVEAEDASDAEIGLNYPEIILDMQDRIARLERMVADTAQPAPLFLRLTLVHDKSSVWISVRNIAAMQARSLGTCLVMFGANEDMADGWIAGPSAYRVTETIEEIDEKLPAWAVR